MRSLLLKAAVAAILASTPLAGVYAANLKDEPQTRAALVNELVTNTTRTDITDSETNTAPAPYVMAPRVMTHHVTARHVEYKPRLYHIVSELGATNHRLRVDRDRGYVTHAEFARLENRSHAIRSDAMRIAGRHDGALPKASYVELQGQVNRLNHAIHRAATA